MRNPEKLEQALNNMQRYLTERAQREQEEALASNADNLYRNDGDYSMGPNNASITIVEFFDYNCGYCKRSFAPLMEVLEDNKMCASCSRNILFWVRLILPRALHWQLTTNSNI